MFPREQNHTAAGATNRLRSGQARQAQDRQERALSLRQWQEVQEVLRGLNASAGRTDQKEIVLSMYM